MSFFRHEEIYQSDEQKQRRNPDLIRTTPWLIVLMSFRLVIPWRVALQQSSPPLRQPARFLAVVLAKASSFFGGPRGCLNFLSHERGAPQLSRLVANGENVKVIQELMRHASSRSTLEIYCQARSADKRAAQQRVMQMIFPEDLNRSEANVQPPSEHLDNAFEWIN
jgi:integrase